MAEEEEVDEDSSLRRRRCVGMSRRKMRPKEEVPNVMDSRKF